MASQRVLEFSRLALWRAAGFVALILIAALSAAPAAAAPRAYAGIVVDAKSGKVLYSSQADDERYPASVSKVMTLYILFQELTAGRIKLTDKMPVSRWAASASPTKLGLKPGSTITVENAIRAVVTLSANDMARVIAEYIGGSEADFARRMTLTAHSLGMLHTTYVNASGLPDSRQITTVRDQAILARAIFEHFPKFYAYFQTRSFSYGRRTYGNHNNLLGVNGIDGIKTGYTGAAGYNLMTAARTDDKHLVVVAFGFPSAGRRDAKVRDLVQTYLPQAKTGDYLQTAMIPIPGRKGSPLPADTVEVASDNAPVMPLPSPSFRDSGADDEAPADPQIGVGDVDTVDAVTVASLPPLPLPRPVIDAPVSAAAAATTLAALPPKPAPAVMGAYTQSYKLGAPPALLGQTPPSAPLVPPVGVGDNGQAIDLLTSGSIEAEVSLAEASAKPMPTIAQPMPSALPEGWIIQIGAAPTHDGASSLIDAAGAKVTALAQFQGFVQRFDKDGQTYYRARFGGFSGQDAANVVCNQLKQVKMSCLAMQG